MPAQHIGEILAGRRLQYHPARHKYCWEEDDLFVIGNYLHVVRNYYTFEGRASRREYWAYILVHGVIALGLFAIDSAFGLFFGADYGVLSTTYGVALAFPTVAVAARRLHDVDLSSCWLAISAVPLIGFLVLLSSLVQRGTRGDNRFGADPYGPRHVTMPSDGGSPYATRRGRFFVCPWCEQSNPAGRSCCQWCNKPYREEAGQEHQVLGV